MYLFTDGETDTHTGLWNAVDKVGGAVDRINDPRGGIGPVHGLTLRCGLFSYEPCPNKRDTV